MTELPFKLKGTVFRSAMPFGTYDPQQEILDEYTQNDISVVVPLASVEECKKRANKDLHKLYEAKGFAVVSLPIEDFGVPRKESLTDVINKVIGYADAGRNVVVHCSAGQGRTGMFMACMAKALLGMSGDEAIIWTRKYISGAVETYEQENFVRDYVPGRG